MKCFVIAMEKEAAPVIEKMTKTRSFAKYGKKVTTGRLFGRKAAVIVCGVGKANAAAGAQYAIDAFSPDCIINIGVAGGLNERCVVGSIYGIAGAVQYDFDLTAINGTAVGTLDEFKENYLRLNTLTRHPLRKIGTGDRFNDNKTDYRLLTKELGADVRDMECGAIVQVCLHAKIPVYAFKAISDTALGGSTPEQYAGNLNLCIKTISDKLEGIVSAIDG